VLGLLWFGVKHNILFYSLFIHTLWELWQISIRMTPYWTYRGRNDVLMDTLAFLIGAALTQSLVSK
jgi:hypothetical protein